MLGGKEDLIHYLKSFLSNFGRLMECIYDSKFSIKDSDVNFPLTSQVWNEVFGDIGIPCLWDTIIGRAQLLWSTNAFFTQSLQKQANKHLKKSILLNDLKSEVLYLWPLLSLLREDLIPNFNYRHNDKSNIYLVDITNILNVKSSASISGDSFNEFLIITEFVLENLQANLEFNYEMILKKFSKQTFLNNKKILFSPTNSFYYLNNLIDIFINKFSVKSTNDTLSNKTRFNLITLNETINEIKISLKKISLFFSKEILISPEYDKFLTKLDLLGFKKNVSLSAYTKELELTMGLLLSLEDHLSNIWIKQRPLIEMVPLETYNSNDLNYHPDLHKTVTCDNLFHNSGPYLIAIMGVMGAGKTTLVYEMINSFIRKPQNFSLLYIDLKHGLTCSDLKNEELTEDQILKILTQVCIKTLLTQSTDLNRTMIKNEIFHAYKNDENLVLVFDALDEFQASPFEEQLLKKLLRNIKKGHKIILLGRDYKIIEFESRKKIWTLSDGIRYDKLYKLSLFTDTQALSFYQGYKSYLTSKLHFTYIPDFLAVKKIIPPASVDPDINFYNPLVLKAILSSFIFETTTTKSIEQTVLTPFQILNHVVLFVLQWYVWQSQVIIEKERQFSFFPNKKVTLIVSGTDHVVIDSLYLQDLFFLMYEELAKISLIKGISKLEFSFNEITLPIDRQIYFDIMEDEKINKFLEGHLKNRGGFLQPIANGSYQFLPERIADFFVISKLKRLIEKEHNFIDLKIILGHLMGNSQNYRNLILMLKKEPCLMDQLTVYSNELLLEQKFKELAYLKRDFGLDWHDDRIKTLHDKITRLALVGLNLNVLPDSIGYFTSISSLGIGTISCKHYQNPLVI